MKSESLDLGYAKVQHIEGKGVLIMLVAGISVYIDSVDLGRLKSYLDIVLGDEVAA